MNISTDRRALLTTSAILLLTPLIFLAPALRPGYMLLAGGLPYLWDPLWQPLAPPGAIAGANPILGDQFYQFHSWNLAIRQALAQGELPLWNPAINGGQPLFGNGLAGVLDPFNLMGRLFPITTSYVVGALLRLWVAGGFTYAYSRTIGLSRPAAWLAMLTFIFSGPFISWLWGTPSHVLAWLPALLWAGEKLLTSQRLNWALVAAGLLALLIFSAQPEMAFQIGVVWGIYLLCRAAWLEDSLWRGLRRHIGWWLLVALLGVTLAAVEVLPFVDTLRHSLVFNQRLATTTTDLALWLRRIFLSWQEWPTLVTTLLPNFLGREAGESYWYPTGNSIENNAYAGVLPLLLALLALWATWRAKMGRTPDKAQQPQARLWAHSWVWLWGSLGACVLALAVALPLFAGLHYLFPFNLTALGRLRGIYVFAVAILAGLGLDALRADHTLRRPLGLLLAGAAALNLILVVAAYTGFTLYADQLIASGRAFMEAHAGTPHLDRSLPELYALVDTRQQAKLAMLRPSNPVMYVPLLVGGMVALLLWLHRNGRLARPWLTGALITLVWLDLLWVNGGINPSAPTSWLAPRPPAVEYLQRQPGVFRVVGTHQILNPNMTMLTQPETAAGPDLPLESLLEDVRGYDPMAVQRYTALLSGLNGYAPVHYHNYFTELDDPRLDLFNATYGLSRTAPSDPRWERVFDDPSGVTIYRSRTALPRAYLVYAAEVVENAQASLARTLDPSFDARQNVILEELPVGWSAPTSAPVEPAEVDFTMRRANIVQLQVTTAAPGLLVLTDTYAPGWRAAIGNQATPIYVANHAFRAVVVPAGTHRITFTYAPAALTWGTRFSAGALLVMLAGMIWTQRSPGRRREDGP